MKFRNTSQSWGVAAKLFHWALAALILAQIALGIAAANWPLSPAKLDLFVWHKSTGMLILVLALARLAWRLANPVPELPADTPAWERAAARASHALLYLLIIAMPLSGWVVSAASGIPFRIFRWIPLPAIVGPDKAVADYAALLHFSLLLLLAALLCVHVAAALRHHYVKRNDVLLRMLPTLGKNR